MSQGSRGTDDRQWKGQEPAASQARASARSAPRRAATAARHRPPPARAGLRAGITGQSRRQSQILGHRAPPPRAAVLIESVRPPGQTTAVSLVDEPCAAQASILPFWTDVALGFNGCAQCVVPGSAGSWSRLDVEPFEHLQRIGLDSEPAGTGVGLDVPLMAPRLQDRPHAQTVGADLRPQRLQR